MMPARKPLGRWKRGTPMRCSRCQRRVTIRTIREDKWPTCCKLRMYVDRYRHSGVEHQKNKCQCGGYPVVHRRGSLFCDHGAAAQAGFGFIRSKEEDEAFQQWRAAR
jgi:hypothetical protein